MIQKTIYSWDETATTPAAAAMRIGFAGAGKKEFNVNTNARYSPGDCMHETRQRRGMTLAFEARMVTPSKETK